MVSGRRTSTTRRTTSRRNGTPKKKGGFFAALAKLVTVPMGWWDDAMDAAHTVKKAHAGHQKRAGARAKERPVLEADKAAGRAAVDAGKAARKAARQALIDEEERLAAERAQVAREAKAQKGRPAAGAPQYVVGQVAHLCGFEYERNQKCTHPVLPGTLACAAGHPQGGSSFGGLRPGQRIINAHDPRPGAAARGGSA